MREIRLLSTPDLKEIKDPDDKKVKKPIILYLNWQISLLKRRR
jgi:hypothetical protein